MPFLKLEKPNSQYLSIAQSWFNLGDYSKAKEVLEQITLEFHQHPEVLKLREQNVKRSVPPIGA